LKNLKNSCEKKKNGSEEPENLTTQEGNIQAVPISGHRPVPSSTAASNATTTLFPFQISLPLNDKEAPIV
jgi:hypothetical protein